MHSVYIGIGSNIERESNINHGLNALVDNFGELTLSSVYETIPYGFDGENFYNLVAGFSTGFSVQEVNTQLKEIEQAFGRESKTKKYDSRSLDIDLLLYDDLVIDDSGIQLPRDDLLKYSFVLCPMAELAPDLIHPIEQKNYQQLWLEFDKPINDLWKVDFALDCELKEKKNG